MGRRNFLKEALQLAKEKGDPTYKALVQRYEREKNESLQDKIRRIQSSYDPNELEF